MGMSHGKMQWVILAICPCSFIWLWVCGKHWNSGIVYSYFSCALRIQKFSSDWRDTACCWSFFQGNALKGNSLNGHLSQTNCSGKTQQNLWPRVLQVKLVKVKYFIVENDKQYRSICSDSALDTMQFPFQVKMQQSGGSKLDVNTLCATAFCVTDVHSHS